MTQNLCFGLFSAILFYFIKPPPCRCIHRCLRPGPLPPPVSWWQIALCPGNPGVATHNFQTQKPGLRRLGAPNQVEFSASWKCKHCTESLISFTCISNRTHVPRHPCSSAHWTALPSQYLYNSIKAETRALSTAHQTKLLVNIHICTFHLYWSVLTCTVQFILTVVPTTGYGVVTFKILSIKGSIVCYLSPQNKRETWE